MSNSIAQTENAQTTKSAKSAKSAKSTKSTKSKKMAKTENLDNVLENLETVQPQNDKKAVVRKTTEDKVEDLKIAIARQFNLTPEKITKYTILKLSKSSKKIKLVNFYENMIINLVMNPENIAKI